MMSFWPSLMVVPFLPPICFYAICSMLTHIPERNYYAFFLLLFKYIWPLSRCSPRRVPFGKVKEDKRQGQSTIAIATLNICEGGEAFSSGIERVN
jgi:hypothetical protein